MSFTVLSVAYPFALVSPDAVGGAEQVLSALDRGLRAAGARSHVLAAPGSRVAGRLHTGPRLPESITPPGRRAAWDRLRSQIASLVATEAIDLVHFHGVDFARYLPLRRSVPVVATLHLPLSWHEEDPLALRRQGVQLVCVSRSQRGAGGPGWAGVPVIENGVATSEDRPPPIKRGHVLALGRICPEKGYHDAMEAARRAGVRLYLGGRVFPYPAHQRYFHERLAPLLDRHRRFLGPLGLHRKRRLLAGARCVLVPSLVPETSSLVAMEALAAGTPVVARRLGALPEIVETGRTGFLVDNVAEMVEAIDLCRELDPQDCRRAARARFSAPRMIAEYLGLYEGVLRGFSGR